MGSAPSAALPKVVHLEVNGRIRKVIFTCLSSPSDVRDLLCAAAGLLRGGTLSLFDHKGSPVTIDPEMPANPKSSPYKVVVTSSGPSDREVLLEKFCTDVTVQLSRSLRVDEIESEIRNKLAVLERRVEVESGRRAEIAKCRGEIERLREELAKRSLWICDSPCPPSSRRLIPRRDVPSYPKYTLSPETIEALKKPTFDIWQWAPNEMLSCIEYMFHSLGLVNQFNINAITLKRWLLSVQENYRENPFHNFRHSFCVTQMMHGMIQLWELQARLKPIDILILMTSAVCHDLDHPGLNNTYQVNAQTDLARRYGNHSPLEQHHCTVAFQILSEPNCDIFAGTESGVSEEIRKGMTELILATDMARHGDIMDAFAQCLDVFDDQNQEHVRLLEQVLIKCCDTSNEVRPTQVSEPWLDCLLQEYFMQGDREKSEGLPVSPFMDRDRVWKSHTQSAFITSTLMPMFESLTKLFPQLEEVMLQPLRLARDRYQQLGEGEMARLEVPSEPTVASVSI
ncbi:high affinity cGMP-specific 3',5'-cyclic phosphodiesterase 9A-like isoform X2 [Hemitrygon akajei]|uniref:high affinity cGMP-specific 3',5'-cyclic phosphodiesterase 9A-like isoform X2 n=1 Tax=Hemitrygon akajei TaxID=2704970 RepID=UPI003BF9C866